MAKAIEGRVRRPTEEAALARIMRERSVLPRLTTDQLTRVFVDEQGQKWEIRVFHSYVDIPLATFRVMWRRQYTEIPTFLLFLETFNVVHRKWKIG